jgi:glycosyltransferase involved in cell wall biosynthesis
MEIHQIIPILLTKDAMGNQALAITEFVRSLPDRVVVYYHNVTPAHYFEAINPAVALVLARSRGELASLRDFAPSALADSEYNRRELLEMGFQDVTVIPPILGFSQLDIPPDDSVMRRYDDGRVNILFVGRIAPNKRPDDLIRMFAYYERWIDPHARLILVGSSNGTEVYAYWLKQLTKQLGVRNVVWAGPVSQAELAAYYKTASVFVCMSEHEGFGVPLLEAMYCDVPVIAYKAAAIPDTLGTAGILLREKRYEIVAELVDIVVHNRGLRERILAQQQQRLSELTPERVRHAFHHWVDQIQCQCDSK